MTGPATVSDSAWDGPAGSGSAAREEPAAIAASVSDRPRSAAGACLLATAANEPGPMDLHPDSPARVVLCCAFELAVRRRFRAGSPVAEIARTVANAARRHPFVPMDAVAAEMLIRDALGEVVPIEEIPLTVIVATHLVVFAAICDEMAWSDDETEALIAAAEQRAEDLR